MKLICTATAGTMESNDIMVTLEPAEAGGIQIDLTSNVLQQFGAQIRSVITETLKEYGVENAAVTRARMVQSSAPLSTAVTAALFRSAGSAAYRWEVK